MKINIFFLFAAMLICGSMIAQEHYYQMPPEGYENNMTMKARVRIDGVEQQSINIIEIGVFNGNVVTDSEFVKSFGSSNYYRVNLTIGGNGSYPLTFKLYNHSTGEEMLNYTITDPNGNLCESITWSNDASLGGYANPYTLNFVHTFTKDITAYTAGSKDHYYLIASPIGTVSPGAVTNMTSNSFDLYYFDQGQEKEWINYEGSNGNFNIEAGIGYLYANSETVTLTFAGAPIEGITYPVTLVKNLNSNNTTSGGFEGWNLVGNPFAQTAYIDRPFYRMNAYGTELNSDTETGEIAAMEGVFVIANENNETMNFSTTAPSKSGEQLVVNLSQNRGAAIDRAIVRFDEGDMLPKFMLNESNTKLYIPQGSHDYSVVRSVGVEVLPLNFKASRNDTYILSIDAENVEMNYLHLVDNMTGNDVDLLQTPSYTFDATATDYESRFKLVFATGNAAADSFAFYSNGNWIINNDGQATLQVIDVTGRILSSETVNGSISTTINAAPGVYVLRLVNGDNVKVQKVVVR